MSWSSFNQLWMDICHILNSPSYDILLDISNSHTPNYIAKLNELTLHVLASAAFGPQTDGRWHYGRHEEEDEDRDMIVSFVTRLTAHAAMEIMAQLMASHHPSGIQADKVGAWLMNEEATIWDEYEFTNREQMVSNEDYDYEVDCTAVALSSAIILDTDITL
ncbi:hypothetical protein Q9L58_009997 [Maublancomyces gigas]|uniref:Uncharacterized protein n=1 Tax=Discina gigas TaxID=1032678 RepID=A0ABR3G5G2_9PEZI